MCTGWVKKKTALFLNADNFAMASDQYANLALFLDKILKLLTHHTRAFLPLTIANLALLKNDAVYWPTL